MLPFKAAVRLRPRLRRRWRQRGSRHSAAAGTAAPALPEYSRRPSRKYDDEMGEGICVISSTTAESVHILETVRAYLLSRSRL